MSRELIVVIGGAGYIGTEVCLRLEEEHRDFVVVDLLSEADFRRTHADKTWRYYSADIRTAGAITGLLATLQPTHVIHLAAIHFIPDCNRDPETAIATNVHGLAQVVAACKTVGCRLVFTSSASVYSGTDDVCRTGDQPSPTDIYGLTKYSGELLVQQQLSDYAIARLFNVYGNHDPHAHLIPKLYDCARQSHQAELGVSHTARDFVHVSDVAVALCALLDYQGSERIFNIGSGEAQRVTAVVDAVKKLFNPALEVSYAHPRHLRRDDKSHLQADVSRTVAELGWQRRYSFEKGLATIW